MCYERELKNDEVIDNDMKEGKVIVVVVMMVMVDKAD